MNNQPQPITTSEWFGLHLIMLIPIYGLIKLISMAGDKSIHPILSNWAKACLILGVIAVALAILGSVLMSSLFMGIAGGL